METTRFSDHAEPFAITFRWLALIGLIISLAQGNQMNKPWNLLLVVPGAWNLVMTFFAVADRRIESHREISLMIDLLTSATFFWVQGGINGAAFWVGIIPILTGAIFFGMVGALLVGSVFFIQEVISIFLSFPPIAAMQISLIVAGATFLLSFIFGQLVKGTFKWGHLNPERKDEGKSRLQLLEKTLEKLDRDLHDGPVQSISAIAMRSNLARQIPGKDANKMAEEMEKIEESARKATDELRQILVSLKNSKPGKNP